MMSCGVPAVVELLRITLIITVTCSAVTVLVDAAASVVQTLDEFPYDENGKLSTHLLLYPEGNCGGLFERGKPYGYELYVVAGEAELAFFGDYKKDCRAVCVERGTDRSVVSAPMPQRYFEGGDRHSYAEWFESECERVQVTFFNYYSKKPLNVYWENQKTGERVPQGSLEYGELHQRPVHTFLGHRFVFEDGEINKIVLEYTVEFFGVVAIGKEVPLPAKSGHNFTHEIHETLVNEWVRHNRIKRTFSALGFRKGRLPDDLFASMGAFFYNNRKQKMHEEFFEQEEEGILDVFINWWEADTYFIQVPWDLKEIWQARLKKLVEAWVNVELEQTGMYGLRRYEEGSRLLAHVDREETHAASLIINVAQGNVVEPWPIEIHDHAERLHQITMEPGDIVYYESAKCLHARSTPLKGKGAYYVNLFTHYRPVGDDEWFKKGNPKGTPEPLIDIGECRLFGALHQLGQGAVKCDNNLIGPYLSPSLFTATSGESLYDWWRSTGHVPTEVEADGHEEL